MSTGIAPVQSAPPKPVVHDSGPLAHLFDTARFEHMYRIATAMARASLLPDHLKLDRTKKLLPDQQVASNCLLIVNQAVRWGMDPFAVAPETYVVGNKLGFQGKLVAAVVNSRSDMLRPLATRYNSAKGDAFACVVYGSRAAIPQEAHALLNQYAENEDRKALAKLDEMGVLAVRVSVGQAKTDNKMWHSDPEQKLFYTGATKWARRHAPELMLGVLTDDDLDRMRTMPAEELAGMPTTLDALANRFQPAAITQQQQTMPKCDDQGEIIEDEEPEQTEEETPQTEPVTEDQQPNAEAARQSQEAFQQWDIEITECDDYGELMKMVNEITNDQRLNPLAQNQLAETATGKARKIKAKK